MTQLPACIVAMALNAAAQVGVTLMETRCFAKPMPLCGKCGLGL